jgi:hypothetical protein
VVSYLPKPEPWALDPAETERPDWWQGATVLPFWERRGVPRIMGKAGSYATLPGPGIPIFEGTDYDWTRNESAGGLRTLTNAGTFAIAPDTALCSRLDRATILASWKPTDTTLRVSAAFTSNRTTVGDAAAVASHMPFSDGTVYWDYGGVSAGTTRVTWSGYTKDVNRTDYFAFRAGPAGMSIWHNGAKVASHSTAAATRSRAGGEGYIWLGHYGAFADLGTWNFFALIDEEWPDGRILEWFRDPFVMLRPRARALRIAAATQAATTTPVSASATAIGVASVTKQVGKIVGATADGVESVTVAEVSLVTAAATAVGVASVTLLFIAAPPFVPETGRNKAESLLVNPGQWIKA